MMARGTASGSSNQTVSVAIPVRGATDHLERAMQSLLAQTHVFLDVMVITVQGDATTMEAAKKIAGGDARVRVMERPRPGLAPALNFALREARGELVARMDADDWCHPERIAKQVAVMEGDPTIAAVGTAFAVVDEQWEQELERLYPPERPEEVRWRLLLGNVLAHGSMMLRRKVVIDAGGYDDSIARGQDFELWLRMTGKGLRIANIPEVLYWHRMPSSRLGQSAGDDAQARSAASAMVHTWARLGPSGLTGEIEDVVARVVRGTTTASRGLTQIGDVMAREGPTREGMSAWLWCRHRTSESQWPAMEAGRRAKVREVGRALREAGVAGVWLWGAGSHTAWVVEHKGDLGIPIEGVVDDERVGEMVGGFRVVGSDGLGPKDSALISSDTAEDFLWRASAGARGKGTRVWRLYGGEERKK